jgi:hypothetical protein
MAKPGVIAKAPASYGAFFGMQVKANVFRKMLCQIQKKVFWIGQFIRMVW